MLTAALLMATSVTMAQPAEPNVPKEILTSMEYFVGKWKGEGKEGGTAVREQFTGKWSPGKHCTILNGRTRTTEGVVHVTLISGWDALNKEIVDYSYRSDGSHSVERWKIASPTVEEATSTGVSASGKPTKAVFRIEKRSQDEFLLTVTERVEGDERQPDIVIEYTRVKSDAETP